MVPAGCPAPAERFIASWFYLPGSFEEPGFFLPSLQDVLDAVSRFEIGAGPRRVQASHLAIPVATFLLKLHCAHITGFGFARRRR